ncbi:hypothetical protein AB1J06_15440 [Agrobacterium tumefaciens]
MMITFQPTICCAAMRCHYRLRATSTDTLRWGAGQIAKQSSAHNTKKGE